MFAYRALWDKGYRKLYAVHLVYHRKTIPPRILPEDLVNYMRAEIMRQGVISENIPQLQATLKAIACYDYLFDIPWIIKRYKGLRRN